MPERWKMPRNLISTPVTKLTVRYETAGGGHHEVQTPNIDGTIENALAVLVSLMICPQRMRDGDA